MSDLRFSLLGPVRAWCGAEEIALGSPQQRALLAALLMNRGEPVSTEQAVAALWEGDAAPRTAEATVRTYIYRLRRDLGAHQVGIWSRGGGYALRTGSVAVDTGLFESFVQDARRARASGDLGLARRLFREGLGLWRGTPFTGIDTTYFTAERARLEQLRSTAMEEMTTVEIELGDHAEAVATLRTLVTAQPLREKAWELLLRALSGLGRRAEALAAYQDAQRALRAELGLEAGPELREMHRRILASEPMPSAAKRVHLAVPAQLPPDQDGFVGREAELAEIASWLLKAHHLALVGLTGSVGLGKTALAVHAGHALRSHFPDGQLYAVLSNDDGMPVAAEEVLTQFLRALGVAEIPGSLPELMSLWRTTVDGNRLLVVLDDALSSAQVLPLLPASPGSAVLLTSWRRLIDLPGLHSITLGGLPRADALRLLASVAGRERLNQDPRAAIRLVETCSCQPLALRVAGARLLAGPHRAIGDVEAEIRTDGRVQYALADEYELVDARYRRALERLSPELSVACRTLALADHKRLDVPTAARILNVSQTRAHRTLEALLGAHFIEFRPDSGGYSFENVVTGPIRRQAIGEFGTGPDRTDKPMSCMGCLM